MWCVAFTSPELNDTLYTEAPNSEIARALCELTLQRMGIFDYHITFVKRVNGG